MLWVLVLAVPIYGSASALLQMLGPVHRHAVTPSLATSLLPNQLSMHTAPPANAAFRRLEPASVVKPPQASDDFEHAQSHVGLHVHAHDYDDFERHHHEAGDDTLEALGANDTGSMAAELGAAAAAGSATLPMGMTTPWRLPPLMAETRLWTTGPLARWHDADQRRLDRPPTASRSA